MQKDEDGLLKELKFEIEKLIEMEPEVGPEVSRILIDNWADGRIEKFLEGGTTQTVREYICRVVDYYQECSDYIKKLDIQDENSWTELLDKLRRWAYGYFKRKEVPARLDRIQMAFDCANEAGARLVNIRFPYDVHYDSWSCRVVQNVCLNYIRSHAEKIDYLDFDLSEADEWLRSISVPDTTNQVDLAMDLQEVIDLLGSEDRKQLIQLHYFEGKGFSEISEILDRTKNALYKLHFDALNNLRKILLENGYIVNKPG